jgi:two-component system response regulator FixJ
MMTQSFLKSVSRLLRAAGYTVQGFESAEKFLEQLAPGMSGCVLTDLQMPGLDGLELQAALAKLANPLPVVFLSAQGDIPTTVQAMRQRRGGFFDEAQPEGKIAGRGSPRIGARRAGAGRTRAIAGIAQTV